MPAALIAALAPIGTLAFVALIVWRLFPGGVPGTLTAWTQYRTTTTARTKALDSDERTSRIGMEMLRLSYGTDPRAGSPDHARCPRAAARQSRRSPALNGPWRALPAPGRADHGPDHGRDRGVDRLAGVDVVGQF